MDLWSDQLLGCHFRRVSGWICNVSVHETPGATRGTINTAWRDVVFVYCSLQTIMNTQLLTVSTSPILSLINVQHHLLNTHHLTIHEPHLYTLITIHLGTPSITPLHLIGIHLSLTYYVPSPLIPLPLLSYHLSSLSPTIISHPSPLITRPHPHHLVTSLYYLSPSVTF